MSPGKVGRLPLCGTAVDLGQGEVAVIRDVPSEADQRVVFIMIELDSMTALEIVALLELKVPTVYSRLRLTREAMRRPAIQGRGS